MFKEFKEFAIKGSVTDMAVGIIVGAVHPPVIHERVHRASRVGLAVDV